jgi:signal transduction histidine kinase
MLNLTMSGDLPKFWAYPNRLLQILINLVSNANKYTKENGEISISAEKTLNSWLPGENDFVAHIWVQDNGYGISEDDQKSVFQKFFRSEHASVRANSGTGLGLNITKSLVEMQGGIMWFESEYQKGTTFHFVVPFASFE